MEAVASEWPEAALERDRKSETKLRKLFMRLSKSLSLEFDREKRLFTAAEELGTDVTPRGSRSVLDGSYELAVDSERSFRKSILLRRSLRLLRS